MKLLGSSPSGFRRQERSKNASVVGPRESSAEEAEERVQGGEVRDDVEPRVFVENLVERGVVVHGAAGLRLV